MSNAEKKATVSIFRSVNMVELNTKKICIEIGWEGDGLVRVSMTPEEFAFAVTGLGDQAAIVERIRTARSSRI